MSYNNLTSLIDVLTRDNPGAVETPIIDGLQEGGVPRPFRPLPNTRQMKVVVNVLDPLFARAHISRKLGPLLVNDPLHRKLRASNRYLRIMQNRLARLLVQGRIYDFWILALMLMRRSRVLRLVALRKVLPNWQRDLPWSKVSRLLDLLQVKIDSMSTMLTIQRKYAAKIKADGTHTWRPIGAPILVDRLFLFLLQSFVVMCLGHYQTKYQHSYIPGRGVSSAWNMIRKHLHFPEIWEFDLKGAFPSISIPFVIESLESVGFPKEICDFLAVQALGAHDKRANPERLVEDKIDVQDQFVASAMHFEKLASEIPSVSPYPFSSETHDKIDVDDDPDIIDVTDIELDPKYRETHLAAMREPSIEELVPPIAKDLRPEPQSFWRKFLNLGELLWMVPGMGTRVDPIVETTEVVITKSDPILDEDGTVVNPEGFPYFQEEVTTYSNTLPVHLRGLPQGGGLSPVLFNFVFALAVQRSWLSQHPGAVLIAYADDFLVFSKRVLNHVFRVTETMAKSGLSFSIEKSRLLKTAGKWQVPSFKFLGNTVESKTGAATAAQANLAIPESLRKETPVLPDFLADDDLDTQDLSIVGTPRSGVINQPLDPAIHRAFKARDKGLWDLLTFKWGRKENLFRTHYRSVGAMLDAWGRHEMPAALIPRPVIDGSQPLLRGHAYKLVKAAANLEVPQGAPVDLDVTSPDLAERMTDLAIAGQFDLLSWLGSRAAGFQQSLLFAPDAPDQEQALHGRKVFESKRPINGRSWVQATAVANPSLARHLTIYNSTSFANLHLLEITRGRLSPKQRKGLRSTRKLPRL